MKIATAFAPANISCIFQIHQGKTPGTTGSTGVGFTLKEGVTVEVSFSDANEILFNGKKIDFSTVGSVIRAIVRETRLPDKSYIINLTSSIQLGSGFGISGASALATAYALNDLLNLRLTRLELAKIAHRAEVENGTGLGDVTNQYFGGFLLKTVNSSRFIVHPIPIANTPVYCKVFSELSTKLVISGSNVENINKAGEKAIKEVQALILRVSEARYQTVSGEANREVQENSSRQARTIKFSDIISISKQFAIESGLLTDPQVINTIQEIESLGGHASMIMLGNAVFADIPFAGATKYLIS